MIDGCPYTSTNRNRLCATHDRNRKLRGDPLAFGPRALAKTAIDQLWVRLTSAEAAAEGECWEWPGNCFTPHGYGHTNRNGEGIASRAAWAEANGPIPEGMWVLHRCDNPPCCRPSHLYLGTPADNTQDMLSRGREARLRDEQSAVMKYPPDLVREIKQRIDGGESQRSVGRSLSINAGYISRLYRGERRSHV